MPQISRHTQVTADKLRSKTISAAEATRIIAAKALERGLTSYLTQVGSMRVGTTRYQAFPTSFSDTPAVTISRLGSWNYETPVAGSAPTAEIMSIVSGSFSVHGTPTSYFLYIAEGSA